MPTYRKIFVAAWEIARKQSSLWLFAVAAAFIGTSGELGILYSSPSLGLNTPDESLGQIVLDALVNSGFLSAQMMGLVSKAILGRPILFFMFLIVATLVIAGLIGLIWLIIVFQGGLIATIHRLLQKETPKWRESFRIGVRSFWPVFVLNLLAGLSVTIFFTALTLFAEVTYPGSSIVFAMVFVLVVLLLIAISFVARFALLEIIIRGQRFGAAVRNAIGLFKQHWLISAETSIALFIVYVVVTTLVSYASYLALSAAINFLGNVPTAINLVVILSSLVLIVFEVLLTAFYWISWVMMFEILSGKKMQFVGWFDRTLGYFSRRS